MSKLPAPLYNELLDGLQLMLALRLSGAPAADTVAATATAWEMALSHGRAWDEAADQGRFQTAFRQMAAEMTWWPAPADLLARLPPRPPPKQLAHHYHPTAAQRQAAAEVIRQCRQVLAAKRIHQPDRKENQNG